MKFEVINNHTVKVQITKDLRDLLTVAEDPRGPRPGRALTRPFQGDALLTRSGNVLNPIGGGWFYLAAFNRDSVALERDLLALEAGYFRRKP